MQPFGRLRRPGCALYPLTCLGTPTYAMVAMPAVLASFSLPCGPHRPRDGHHLGRPQPWVGLLHLHRCDGCCGAHQALGGPRRLHLSVVRVAWPATHRRWVANAGQPFFGVCWSLWNRSRPDGLGATRRTGVRRDLLDGVLPICRPYISGCSARSYRWSGLALLPW